MTTLHAQQLIIEETCKQQGYDAYMAMVANNVSKGRESTTVYGMKAMQEMTDKMEAAFNYFINHQSTLRRKNLAYVNMFKDVLAMTYTNKDGDVLPKHNVASQVAFLLAQTICDKASGRVYLTSAATTLLKKLSRTYGIEFNDEEIQSTTLSGLMQIIRHLSESVDFLNIIIEPRKRIKGVFTGGKAYIQIAEEKVAEMEAMAEQIAKFQVFNKPMVVPPVDHSNLYSNKGGYLTISSALLKRPTKVNGSIHPSIKNFKDASFFNTLNHHQKVGYKINTQLLDLIPALVEMKAKGDSFHYSTEALADEMLANALQEIADVNMNRVEQFGDDAYLLSEKAEQGIKDKWSSTGKQYVNLFYKTLAMADEYKQYDAFYYPVFLDNVGRIYYYGKSLNPQGNELHKALLQFTQGTVMDDTKIMDTFIALGNAMGLDKKTVEFRIQAAQNALPAIMTGDLNEWVALLDTDALLTGLAIVMDIYGYYKAKEAGIEYTSYQPLHMDSCNSGSQINGLLLRDERNCRLSNILNVECNDLEDTYKEVALMVQAKLEGDTSGFFKKFTDAPEIFNRNVFKKSSMVVSNYAGSYLTARSDIEYQLKTRFPEFWASLNKSEKDAFMLESYRCVNASLPASNNYKKFARKLIGAAVKRDGCLAYTQPRSGFPVVLRENETEIKEVKYTEMFTGARKTFSFKTFTDELDKSGTVSRCIPGITHSFDAGILVDVKQRCGDIPMVTIHDSIAVLAGDVSSKLLPAIRECYKEMHDNDDLRVIRDELGFDIEIPYTNDLDASVILNSKHLYS